MKPAVTILFSKFYEKVGVISWLLFHLIWKNYVLYWDFDWKSWIVDFFTHFTHEKKTTKQLYVEKSEQKFFLLHKILHSKLLPLLKFWLEKLICIFFNTFYIIFENSVLNLDVSHTIVPRSPKKNFKENPKKPENSI